MTTCEDTGRPIAYVDKEATGAGNGGTWANAFTTIQAAVDTVGASRRIYIKGYGKADPYVEIVDTTAHNYINLIGSSDWDGVWATRFEVGFGACVVRLNAENPSGRGFDSYANTTFIDCRAEDCSDDGFETRSTEEYLRCVAKNNGGNGFYGSGLFTECESEGNTSLGFRLLAGECVDCTATLNGSGFDFGQGSTALRCVASGNTFLGFHLERFGFSVTIDLTDCSATGNGVHGFYDESIDTGETTLSGCIADGNGEHGFAHRFGALGDVLDLTDCDATDNGECGYRGCNLVSGNTASGNGGGCDPGDYCDGSTDPCGVCDECP